MKKTVFIALCFSFVALQISGQQSSVLDTRASAGVSWGFSGSLGIGGMRLSGDGLNLVEQAGYGRLGEESIIMQVTAGMICRINRLFDISLLLSYLGGGSFEWQDVFGDYDSNFSLYGDSLGIQAEIQPIFFFLHGFQPFIGAGYSLTNGLVDEIAEGFVAGRGPFVVGGLCILNSFGLAPYIPFYRNEQSYFGLRVSVYYRFPYDYIFRLDWDEYSRNYVGPTDLDVMRSFFETSSFTMSSLSFAVELSIGMAGFGGNRK